MYFKKINIKEDDYDDIYALMSFDKKNIQSNINFVLLDKLGKPVIDQKVSRKEFIESLDYYNS